MHVLYVVEINTIKRVVTVTSEFSNLTSKQRKVYLAIESFIKLKGIPPTVREIGDMVGEKTPGAVQGILNRLEQKGVIKREVGMARSIKLVSEKSQYEEPVYIPEVKKLSRRNAHDPVNMYNILKYVPISQEMITSDKSCFALRCSDESMSKSGIKYGDMLFICRDSVPLNGDIVLVLYENHVILRQFYSRANESTVILRADSDLLGKETFDKEEIFIIGKLVGKYSRF